MRVEINVLYKGGQHLLGSNASAPPLDPPPGVLHANLSMYSSASKGSLEGEKGGVLSVPHVKGSGKHSHPKYSGTKPQSDTTYCCCLY